MPKPFVIVSGLPGSGKTTLAHRLAPALHLTLIDKDDILERLFVSKGTGDAAWRRELSRDSDTIFQREAAASNGAVLVSFWRLPGMAADSGTPTDWIPRMSNRIVNVHCACTPEIAAARFRQRERHLGHLDFLASGHETLASLRVLERLDPLDMGPRIVVDTSQEISGHDFNVDDIVRDIRQLMRRII